MPQAHKRAYTAGECAALLRRLANRMESRGAPQGWASLLLAPEEIEMLDAAALHCDMARRVEDRKRPAIVAGMSHKERR